MKFCKPFWSKHNWIRYDKLVEQIFVGGYFAWQKCSKCKEIKFDSCDKQAPAESGADDREARIKKLLEPK